MSDYYDLSKPFRRVEDWNKLIKDINEEIENPPGDCPALEPLDEADPDHIWTKKDIEDVRDKLEEMCPENEFEEDLDKPWRKSIIDELEENMEWCDCGIDEYPLYEKHFALGTCSQDRVLCEDMFDCIGGEIDGMMVGQINRKWWTYQVIQIDHSIEWDANWAADKAAYDASKEPGDPPFEATGGAGYWGRTAVNGGYIWCDGIIHDDWCVTGCEVNYINYLCLANPHDSEIIDAANEAYKQAAIDLLNEHEEDGKYTEWVLWVFSHQAVACEEGDPYYTPEEEEES